jgi:hypothetical protein
MFNLSKFKIATWKLQHSHWFLCYKQKKVIKYCQPSLDKQLLYLDPSFIWDEGATFNISQCFRSNLTWMQKLSYVIPNSIAKVAIVTYLHAVFILVVDQVVQYLCDG